MIDEPDMSLDTLGQFVGMNDNLKICSWHGWWDLAITP